MKAKKFIKKRSRCPLGFSSAWNTIVPTILLHQKKKYYFVPCCYCLCILKIQPFSWPNITFVTLWKFMQISASRTWNYFFPVLLSLKMPRVKTPKNEALWKFSELIERLILKCALISFRPDCPTRKCICCSREFVQHQKH